MKHIRKWLPVPTYDLPGMEGWLEEMAGRGLYLERLNSWTARFRRGEPRSRRFRLQPCCSCEREFSRQEPPEDLVALFAGFGWQCEGWASSFLVLLELWDAGRAYRVLRDLRRRLQEGDPLPPRSGPFSPWRTILRLTLQLLILAALLWNLWRCFAVL